MLFGGELLASGQIISLDLTNQMRTQHMMVAKITTALLGVVVFSLAYLVWMVLLARQSPHARAPQ